MTTYISFAKMFFERSSETDVLTSHCLYMHIWLQT